MLKLIKANQKNFLSKLGFILDRRKSKIPNIDLKIKLIIKDVKKNGDSALVKYEKKFSKSTKTSIKNIKLTKKEINIIIKKLDKKTKVSIDLAYDRILKFHKN